MILSCVEILNTFCISKLSGTALSSLITNSINKSLSHFAVKLMNKRTNL